MVLKAAFSIPLMGLFFLWIWRLQKEPLQCAGAPEKQRDSWLKRVPLPAKIVLVVVLFLLAARSYLGFVILFMIPFGFAFDPARFALLCLLYACYFFMMRRCFLNRRLFSLLKHFCAIWFIAFLSAFHMYFFGDLSQCPGAEKQSREMVPVLTPRICDRSKDRVKEWNECRDDLATSHTLFVDAKTRKIFLPLMGSPRQQFPLCVFNPLVPTKRRRISVHGSVHHLAAYLQHRRVFLPLMSDSRCLVVSMDSLKVLDVLRPTEKSSLIDVVFDDKRQELFILSEHSEVIRISLKTGKIKHCRLHTGGSLYALALNKKTRRLYVSSWIGGNVFKIDAGRMKVLKVKHVNISVMGLQVDEEKNRIFAALPLFARIVELDGATLKVIRDYPAGLGVRDIAYLGNVNMLMAGNYLRRTVDFIDLSTAKKVISFYLGPMVRGVYYDAKHRQAYSVGRCGIYKFDVTDFASR